MSKCNNYEYLSLFGIGRKSLFSLIADITRHISFTLKLVFNVFLTYYIKLLITNSSSCHFQYASKTVDGESVMTYSDFIQKYLGLLTDDECNPTTLEILGKTVDSMCTG